MIMSPCCAFDSRTHSHTNTYTNWLDCRPNVELNEFATNETVGKSFRRPKKANKLRSTEFIPLYLLQFGVVLFLLSSFGRIFCDSTFRYFRHVNCCYFCSRRLCCCHCCVCLIVNVGRQRNPNGHSSQRCGTTCTALRFHLCPTLKTNPFCCFVSLLHSSSPLNECMCECMRMTIGTSETRYLRFLLFSASFFSSTFSSVGKMNQTCLRKKLNSKSTFSNYQK